MYGMMTLNLTLPLKTIVSLVPLVSFVHAYIDIQTNGYTFISLRVFAQKLRKIVLQLYFRIFFDFCKNIDLTVSKGILLKLRPTHILFEELRFKHKVWVSCFCALL